MLPENCFTVSACNNPSDKITEKRYMGTVRLLQPKTKSYMLKWRMWTSCPQLPPASFSRARLARPITMSYYMNHFRQCRERYVASPTRVVCRRSVRPGGCCVSSEVHPRPCGSIQPRREWSPVAPSCGRHGTTCPCR